ncbi:MAG: RagB/SusD family nutrient uptake outer membrane protein [Chitinophagaceae bacterium]|nr:MAG: RagB/SusD family nutrient uptake outer membrane protein [Chitinophagaceae bacterium]
MKKRFLFIPYIFFALVALVSCTKLDERPTDIIDPDKAFRNLNDINLGLIGAYALADYSHISMNATVSDEAMFPTENTVGNSDAFRWLYNPSSGSVTGLYAEGYRAIDRINRTLEGLEKLSFSGNDAAIAARYRGELLALRAYFHFELLRAYASAYQPGALGVPYMKKASIGYPARDPFETVVANAKADLTEAKTLIPTSFTDKSRVTRLAVSALQARIALYEKAWADAITYSSEVITAIPLASKAQFPGIWTDANNSEVVWEAKRVYDGSTDSKVGDFFFRQTGEIVLYAPSFKLINSFDRDEDIRFPAYIKYDPTRTGTKSQYLVNKYIGTATPGLADIKLFRTAEMYLIRAEAKAESGGDGAEDLNALRAARINNYTAETFADKAALINAIMTERFKELAFEGHRFYDLRRRNLPVERLPEDAVNASGAVKLTPAQAQYAFPVPATEVLINKNTVQNPNY